MLVFSYNLWLMSYHIVFMSILTLSYTRLLPHLCNSAFSIIEFNNLSPAVSWFHHNVRSDLAGLIPIHRQHACIWRENVETGERWGFCSFLSRASWNPVCFFENVAVGHKSLDSFLEHTWALCYSFALGLHILGKWDVGTAFNPGQNLKLLPLDTDLKG